MIQSQDIIGKHTASLKNCAQPSENKNKNLMVENYLEKPFEQVIQKVIPILDHIIVIITLDLNKLNENKTCGRWVKFMYVKSSKSSH